MFQCFGSQQSLELKTLELNPKQKWLWKWTPVSNLMLFQNKSHRSKQDLCAATDTWHDRTCFSNKNGTNLQKNKRYRNKALGTVSVLSHYWYWCQQAGRKCLWMYFPAVKPPLHFTGSGSPPHSCSLDVSGRKQAGLLTSQRGKQRGLEQREREETAQSAAHMKATQVQRSRTCPRKTFTTVVVSRSDSSVTCHREVVRGLLDTGLRSSHPVPHL